MDLAFSGLMTAAKQKLDSGHSLGQLAYSVQETAFAMSCEVSERALCVDNGVMIAWLGYQMMNADYQITEEDNMVNQRYRTDMVEVTWR